MPSRIRIGPDGGPYVIVEENNGDLDITTPDNTIDLQNSGLINAALSGVLDAQNNDISNVGALTADSVNTDKGDINHGLVRGRNGERIDAAKFDGADADARLDAALTAALDGNIVYLEDATYTADRTINNSLTIIGTGGTALVADGTNLDAATWTVSESCRIVGVNAGASSEFVLDRFLSTLEMGNYSTATAITVSDDICKILACDAGAVTFQSGTSGGLIDSCRGTSVTDNGTNTVGDIS